MKAAERRWASEEDLDVDLPLVERAVGGDLLAFRQLVEKYEKRVFSIAFGVMGNHQDAEDVTQEAFLKAFRNLSSFRKQSSFYTWLYRIVHNLSIDERRRRYRTAELSSGDSQSLDLATKGGLDSPNAGASEQPDDEFERTQLRQHITEALEELSPDHRAVIMLREVDGLSYAEISDAVGVSKGTVMSRLHHARKKLQKVLKRIAPEATANLSENLTESTEAEVKEEAAKKHAAKHELGA